MTYLIHIALQRAFKFVSVRKREWPKIKMQAANNSYWALGSNCWSQVRILVLDEFKRPSQACRFGTVLGLEFLFDSEIEWALHLSKSRKGISQKGVDTNAFGRSGAGNINKFIIILKKWSKADISHCYVCVLLFYIFLFISHFNFTTTLRLHFLTIFCFDVWYRLLFFNNNNISSNRGNWSYHHQ